MSIYLQGTNAKAYTYFEKIIVSEEGIDTLIGRYYTDVDEGTNEC